METINIYLFMPFLYIIFLIGQRLFFVDVNVKGAFAKIPFSQNHWIIGGFVIILNLVLSGGLVILMYAKSLFVPMGLIGATTTAICMFIWGFIGNGWQGSRRGRRIIAGCGSGFYTCLVAFFAYRRLTLHSNIDATIFTSTQGLNIAIIVCIVAGATCYYLLIKDRQAENSSYRQLLL